MKDTKDLFGNNRRTLSEELVSDYLDGKLSPEKQREVEAFFSDEGMENDAIEGLQQMTKEERQKAVLSLNGKLKHQLTTKSRKRLRPYANNKWTILAVLLILVLIAFAYAILRLTT